MKRKPLVVFLLTLITAGIYGIYWFYKTMRLINEKNDRIVFDFKKIIIFVVVFLAIDLPLFNMVDESRIWLFFIVFSLHVFWIVMVIRTFYRISSNLLIFENDHHIEKKIEPILAVILMFVYLTGIPYMQTHINKIIEADKI